MIARTGVAVRDRMSTKLFNYFAQPPAQQQFCPVAGSVAERMRGLSAAEAIETAPALLAELDRPFTDFYRAYAQYQVDLAEWRNGRTVQVASAKP